MKKAAKYIYDNFEVIIMTVCLDIFIINVLLQIISRVILNEPFVFTEEVSRYLFIWMVFLGLSYSTKANKHISVNALQKHFPFTVRYLTTVLIHIITIMVYIWVLYYGVQYLFFVKDVRTSVLQISKAIVASIIPLSAFLMLLRTGERIVVEFQEFTAERNRRKGEW